MYSLNQKGLHSNETFVWKKWAKLGVEILRLSQRWVYFLISGITGVEGMQASMAADFSIGRFKHLVRLLFVHGHWTYDRLAVMTLYNFFKNSVRQCTSL